MIDLEIEMKELGRKHPTNAHNKISLIQTSHICHRCCAAGRNRHMEEYKHTYMSMERWCYYSSNNNNNNKKKRNQLLTSLSKKKNNISDFKVIDFTDALSM